MWQRTHSTLCVHTKFYSKMMLFYKVKEEIRTVIWWLCASLDLHHHVKSMERGHIWQTLQQSSRIKFKINSPQWNSRKGKEWKKHRQSRPDITENEWTRNIHNGDEQNSTSKHRETHTEQQGTNSQTGLVLDETNCTNSNNLYIFR